MVTVVTASEFRDMVDAARRQERSLTVVDTRPEDSFTGWRIADSINYFYKPFHEFDRDEFEAETGVGPEDTVVVTCAKGKASLDLGEELTAAGYEDVSVIDDGMRGWSAVYDHAEIPLPDDGEAPLDIVQIQRRAKGCLGYLVVGGTEPRSDGSDRVAVAGSDGSDRVAVAGSDGSDRVAIAIDVSRHGEEWRAAAEKYDAEIAAVLDTHVHADHLSGGRALADELDVPYYLPAAAAERDVAHAFEPIGRNEVLDVGGIDLKALATPGHTDDMASYLVGASAVLTGDTLFTDSVGRTELQFAAGGDESQEPIGARTGAERLYDSLHGTLLAEPDDVVVLPGHFSVANDGTTGDVTPGEPVATTVGEARTGIDLLDRDRESFVDRITATLPEKPPNYESVIAANRGIESPPDETAAIELELGPNRCAAEPIPESEADD
ncbi:thiosulfate/3-mercaptopyruvate sulfurtransferase [Halorubrum alkaliphilum]|uniref:Thiosulfate/3-mercaptopyruvate sulfurtransferase n=1 Tax=Halorubrum alkaliphilum TaxID=261290 RepID=A0A8T4GDL9_9EURY|nr:rhodanese-like domain-containing protein [Halorubrum alkaliphilum]MBP1921342.1 thiosulfate/3-mercaptopyruvate sulfurtransferase [Halorubrum alkaliphilum]